MYDGGDGGIIAWVIFCNDGGWLLLLLGINGFGLIGDGWKSFGCAAGAFINGLIKLPGRKELMLRNGGGCIS